MYDPGRDAEVAPQAGGVVSTYSQPGAGQDLPHATTQVAASGDGGQVGVSRFAYDAAGNMTARDVAGQAAQSLSWDREGELRTVSAVVDGDGTVQADESDEYVYSADGDRLVRSQGGTTTVYLPGQELTVTSGGVQATRYYTFAGKTVGVRTGSSFADVTSIFAGHHHTGSLQIANVANTVVRRLLDPFGAPRDAAAGEPTSSVQGKYGYIGFGIGPDFGYAAGASATNGISPGRSVSVTGGVSSGPVGFSGGLNCDTSSDSCQVGSFGAGYGVGARAGVHLEAGYVFMVGEKMALQTVLYLFFSVTLTLGLVLLVFCRRFGVFLEARNRKLFGESAAQKIETLSGGFRPTATAIVFSLIVVIISALMLTSIDEISNIP